MSLTEKQVKLREYLSISEGERVCFKFRDGGAITGIVANKTEPYRIDVEVGERIIPVSFFSDVEGVFRDPYPTWEEDNNIIGKNWVCKAYNMKENTGDKEFVQQLMDKWGSLTESDKYIISDVMAESLVGENFKLFLDAAISKSEEKETFENLGRVFYYAFSIYSVASLLQDTMKKMTEEKPEKEQ